MTVTGGQRARLIKESLYNWIYDGIEELGWFDSGRRHLPVQFLSVSVDSETEIPLNTAVLSDEDTTDFENEMGSNFSEHLWTFFFDFYAENDAIGLHLVRDVRDLISGRMDDIGYGTARLPVYDYMAATPTVIFSCDIEDTVIDRARGFSEPFRQHWYTCRFTVVDYYGNETY